MSLQTNRVVVEQHAEEAAFLWLLRTHAVDAPHYNLRDLVDLDDRIEANLDGLRNAEGIGWESCRNGLSQEEAGEVFVGGVLAFEGRNETRIRAVFDAASASPESSPGLVSALAWLPFRVARGPIKTLLEADSPRLRRLGIAACALHRQDPGQALVRALNDEDLKLKSRALRAVGELGLKLVLPVLKSNLQSPDHDCRFWSAWSAALLGDHPAVSVLRFQAEACSPHAEKACALALCRMPFDGARLWWRDLAQRAECRRIAAIGAGVLGDILCIPWLIEMMAVPLLARIAGEAFAMITGVDIAYQDLEGQWPEGFQAGPSEDPEDEDVAMDEDENLPWPDVERIQEWWQTHRADFQSSRRFLLGKAISPPWLHEVLRIGFQVQRRTAALELAIRPPGQPLFQVRAAGFRQSQLLFQP